MTSTDLSLFDFPELVAIEPDPELSLAERYSAFIAANPSVLDAFEQLTEQWLSAGHKRVSIKFVAENARWRSGIAMPGQEWRINNSFVAFIARDLVRRRPDWSDAIEFRVQKAVA